MQFELPILTSDRDFAHERCQDAAMYFDPMEADSVVRAMLTAMESAELRERRVENGGDSWRRRRPGKSVLSEVGQVVGSLFSNTAQHLSGGFATSHDTLIRRWVESLVDGAPPVSAEEGRETVRVTTMIADCL